MKLHGIGRGGSFFPLPKNKQKNYGLKRLHKCVEKHHKLKGIFVQTP
jgi:hypothetical protein